EKYFNIPFIVDNILLKTTSLSLVIFFISLGLSLIIDRLFVNPILRLNR
ncbi:acyltransferase, partial [Escherichia coli]|nr:acyltransferase [Escherichia coli]